MFDKTNALIINDSLKNKDYLLLIIVFLITICLYQIISYLCIQRKLSLLNKVKAMIEKGNSKKENEKYFGRKSNNSSLTKKKEQSLEEKKIHSKEERMFLFK